MEENPNPTPSSNGKVFSEKKIKSKPIKILPTERISFSKQLDLVRAFAAASGPNGKIVGNNDVADIVQMNKATVWLCNAFFVDVGFLQKTDGGFLPSPEVTNFNLAYQWNPEGAGQKLAPLIQNTWFAQALLPKLGFRSLTEDEAIGLLAEASNADPDYKSQLRALLSFLQTSGLITWEGNQIREAKMIPAQNADRTITPATASLEIQPKPPTLVTTTFTQPMEGVVQFHVSVKVSMADFASWQPERITAFFSGIAQVLAAKGAIEQDASK